MKSEIHPQYKDVKVTCSCGSEFVTRSTLGKESLSLEVCAKCHPFYTGTQKIMDTAGRVDRFRQKYGMKGKKADAEAPAKAEAAPEKVEVKEEPVKAAPAKAEAKKKPAAKKADDAKDASKE